ncbi:hypothetical protein ABK040_003938 [Willaertia magna]
MFTSSSSFTNNNTDKNNNIKNNNIKDNNNIKHDNNTTTIDHYDHHYSLQVNNNNHLNNHLNNTTANASLSPTTKTTTTTIINQSFLNQLKIYLNKIQKYTIGNRRLKTYLYSILKFFSITYIQANKLLPSNHFINENDHLIKQLQLTLQIISYIFMVLLILSFTERFIREIYSIYKKKKLNILLNWIECFIFIFYVIYSLFTASLHFYFIIKEYQFEKVNEKHNDGEISSESLEQTLAIEVFEILLHLYIIFDKATHYLHSGHSVSLFLSKSQHIPKQYSDHNSDHHSDHSDNIHNDESSSNMVRMESNDGVLSNLKNIIIGGGGGIGTNGVNGNGRGTIKGGELSVGLLAEDYNNNTSMNDNYDNDKNNTIELKDCTTTTIV